MPRVGPKDVFPHFSPRWLGQRLQVISIAEGGLAVLSRKDDDQLCYEGQDLKFPMAAPRRGPESRRGVTWPKEA